MSLQETSNCQAAKEYMSNEELIRVLKQAKQEELGAQNTYSLLIESLKASNGKPELINRIAEILADEVNHEGSLQWCINQLDVSYKTSLEAGLKGA